MTTTGPKFDARRLLWRDVSLGVITLGNGRIFCDEPGSHFVESCFGGTLRVF